MNKSIRSLQYWLGSIVIYSALASVFTTQAASPMPVNVEKLAAAVAAVNGTKPGTEAHIKAAYDYCRIAIGPLGMPVWVNGQIKCRNLVDEAKKN